MVSILEQAYTEFDCTTQLGDIIGVVGFVLRVIQYAVPIILIVIGSIDLVKAVIAGKEDDVKKNQKILIKRAIAAVLVFLVPMIVSTLLGLIGSESWKDCWNDNKGKGIINVDDWENNQNNNQQNGA